MLSINVRGADSLTQLLKRASGAQMRAAAAAALNDLGFAAQKEMRAQIAGAFNQPTAFIARSPKVKKADEKTLTVRVWPTLNTEGQSSGVTPQMVLRAQEKGGKRSDKRSERALRAMGLLPPGVQTALPHTPWPGSVKGGDLSGAFIRKLLRQLARTSAAGPQRRRRRGAGRGGERFFVLPRANGRLVAGIWGVRGRKVAPVLIFTEAGSYRARVRTEEILRAIDVQVFFEKKMRYRLRRIFEGGSA